MKAWLIIEEFSYSYKGESRKAITIRAFARKELAEAKMNEMIEKSLREHFEVRKKFGRNTFSKKDMERCISAAKTTQTIAFIDSEDSFEWKLKEIEIEGEKEDEK